MKRVRCWTGRKQPRCYAPIPHQPDPSAVRRTNKESTYAASSPFQWPSKCCYLAEWIIIRTKREHFWSQLSSQLPLPTLIGLVIAQQNRRNQTSYSSTLCCPFRCCYNYCSIVIKLLPFLFWPKIINAAFSLTTENSWTLKGHQQTMWWGAISEINPRQS